MLILIVIIITMCVIADGLELLRYGKLTRIGKKKARILQGFTLSYELTPISLRRWAGRGRPKASRTSENGLPKSVLSSSKHLKTRRSVPRRGHRPAQH